MIISNWVIISTWNMGDHHALKYWWLSERTPQELKAVDRVSPPQTLPLWAQSGNTNQELKAVDGASPLQTPALWAQSGRTTQELKAVERASPPQTLPLWAQCGRTTQELNAMAMTAAATTETFCQSIQVPTSTHSGTTHPVRAIPHYDSQVQNTIIKQSNNKRW